MARGQIQLSYLNGMHAYAFKRQGDRVNEIVNASATKKSVKTKKKKNART